MSGFWLRVRSKTPRDFRVYDGAVIGRLPDCAVYLPHRSVSRRHAVLRIVGDLVHVEDQGSSNGTFVNGQPVEHGTLIAGDELRIGVVPLELIHEVEGAEPAEFEGSETGSAEDLEATRADSEEDRFSLDEDLEELTLPDDLGSAPKAAPAHPAPSVRVRAPASPASPTPSVATAEPTTHHESRVLQYRRKAQGGLFATDLSQWSTVQRSLAVLAVLSFATLLFFLVAWMVGSF